jgi:site-specific DNA-methyltransferase (adenine-specific)
MLTGHGNCYIADYTETINKIVDNSVQLLWTDPPFGTNRKQTISSAGTDFWYKDYDEQEAISTTIDMLVQSHHLLRPTAVVAVCLDYRIVHEVKVGLLQNTTGLFKFEREIIWHFELGAISKNWWTNKHNTILLFSVAGGNPLFLSENVPKVPRKAGRGSYDSDERKVNSVWTMTMGPTDSQRTGYPNQKPLELVERFVKVHTQPGDLVFDPFAGSGTTGVAAMRNDCNFVLCDTNPQVAEVWQQRGLLGYPIPDEWWQ